MVGKVIVDDVFAAADTAGGGPVFQTSNGTSLELCKIVMVIT
jgi:hypothetical protein